MMGSVMQPTKMAVSSGAHNTSPTRSPDIAAVVEESTMGVGRGRSLASYEQESLQAQGNTIQTPQVKRSDVSCAAAAARRSSYEALTWRHFAGDWR